MRLLPREEDRLLLFLAAELARRRRGRGLRLTQAEAAALVADEVCEAARDGGSYDDAVARGYAAVTEDDVLEDVAELLPRVEVEAAFADGSRLVVLVDPVRRDAAPELGGEPPPAWVDDARAVELELVNEGAVPVGLTSHFHLFEVNRDVRLDRAAAWGLRLAVTPGTKLFLQPGEPRTVRAIPFAGARVVRGHGGLAEGPLDAPGAKDAALEAARRLGYRGA